MSCAAYGGGADYYRLAGARNLSSGADNQGAPSGSASQMELFALCPDLLVGTSSPWEEQELQFIP